MTISTANIINVLFCFEVIFSTLVVLQVSLLIIHGLEQFKR